jgi:D-amino peptidase
MATKFLIRASRNPIFMVILAFANLAFAQSPRTKKVYLIANMPGVDNVFNEKTQLIPYQSPRWEESRKIFTTEVNAAVDGLFAGGATGVDVFDAYAGGMNLSTLTIQPKARLLVGRPVSPTLELDPTYSAVVFIGQQAMAGTEKGILNQTYDPRYIQNVWINGTPTGEIGVRTMLAGYFGIPVILLSGDDAACKEFRRLVPDGECAVVKWGESRFAGETLPTPKARDLIREMAQRAMERLPEIKPYRILGPVEVKVEFTTEGTSTHTWVLREGVEHLNQRTWVFRGKDIVDAWLKFRSF